MVSYLLYAMGLVNNLLRIKNTWIFVLQSSYQHLRNICNSMGDTKARNLKCKYCEITVSEAGPEKDLIYKIYIDLIYVVLFLWRETPWSN